MLRSPVKIIKKVVLTNLAKRTISNPDKTYAEAMIDGTITEADLRAINSVESFPNNNFNKFKLAEGEYRSMDAMQDFVELISEHLSDAALYHVTHTLAKIEVTGDNTEAYRQSTLAKYFAIYEAKRHDSYDNERRARYCSSTTSFSSVLLSHMHAFVLPLAQRNWINLEQTLPTYVSFNLKQDIDKAVTYAYTEINEFPKLGFDAGKLDTIPPASKDKTDAFMKMVKSGTVVESESTISAEPVTSSAKPAAAAQSSLNPVTISGPQNFRLVSSFTVSGPANFRSGAVSANLSSFFAAEYHRIQLEMHRKLFHFHEIARENNRIIEMRVDEIQELRSRLLRLKEAQGDKNDASLQSQIGSLESTIAERRTKLRAMALKHSDLLDEIENRKAGLQSLSEKMREDEAGNANNRSLLRQS